MPSDTWKPLQIGAGGWLIGFDSTSGTVVPSLGTNLDGAAYWTTGFPYIDLMHQASEWVPQSSWPSPFNTGATLDLDSSGWVTSLPAGTWAGIYPVLHNPLGADTAGDRYVVMYDGDGTFQGALGATISEASPGRFVLTSAWDGTVGFQITSTNPADYVRDIHVVREDQLAYFDAGIDFNPQFLEKVEDFHTFRFMDWMSTNAVYDANGVVPWPDSSNAAKIEWVDRPLMTDAQWNKGVPVEAMVEICNLAGADGWFNMPINASDDYVRQFATYVRDHLNPSLEIHVEFSNEVWNWAFPQSHYADAHDAGFGNWMEWYGVRTAQVGRIWNEVFGESPTGGEDATGRVHVVYNTQAGWQGLEFYGLETQNWYENGVHVRASDYFDEYAVTGYYSFNTADHNVVRSWWSNPDGGFDAAVASLRQNIDGPLKAAYAYHAGKAAERGLELTTYESGYGEVATDEMADYQQFLIDVQRQPELYGIEKANYQNFKDAGGGLYMNFGIIGAPSKWGSWSALESLYQETSPRYEALTDWNATVAPWYESGRDPSVFDSSWMLYQNSAPTITSNGGGDTAAASIAENTTAVTTVTATDPDAGQMLSYSIGGGADAGKFTIGSTTGALSFITAPNFEVPTDVGGNNVYDVTVQVSDGNGGSNTQAIAVTVAPVNDASVAVDDSYITNEDTTLTVAAAGVLGNDADADGDPLSAILVSGPAHGSMTLNANGALSYTPFFNYFGPDSFTYKAYDGQADSNVATVSLTVTPVNDVPVANDDIAGVAKGRAITADAQHGVLVNDGDLDGDGLSVSAVNGSAANVGQAVVGTYGSLTVNTDGSYVYVANKGKLPPQIVAQDSFTYTASDGHGGTSTAQLTITITKPGAAYLARTDGNDTLTAGNGPTVLDGGNGDDFLTGGIHADVLIGGRGTDTMTGGGGPDKFVFGPNFGAAVITDLNPADVIQFDHSLFASFADVQAHAASDGHGNTVTDPMQAVALSSLHPSDFFLV